MADCLATEPIYQSNVPGDINPDWDGGARSTAQYGGNCYFGWTVPRVVRGVVIGLNDNDEGTSYLEIDFGFRFKDGQYKLVEYGQILDPETAWTSYDNGDRFYVMRLDGRIIYLMRPTGTSDDAVFFDRRVAGYRLPGNIIAISTHETFNTVFLDAALWAENDTVDNERSGILWRTYGLEMLGTDQPAPGSPEDIDFGLSGTVFGYININIAGGELGATEAAAALELPLSISASGSFDEGANLELPLNVLGAGFPMNTYMIGEIPLTGSGGIYQPGAGDGNVGIIGSLLLEVTARGYDSSTKMIGEVPLIEMDAVSSVVTNPVTAGIWGALPAPVIYATGSDIDGPFYNTWLVGEVPLPVLDAAGQESGDDVGLVGAIPAPILNATGTSTIDPVSSWADIVLPLPNLEAITSPEVPNEFFIILKLGGEFIVEPPIPGESDVLETFFATSTALSILTFSLTESVQISTPLQTFYQSAVELLDTAQALVRDELALIVAISETFNIDDAGDLTVTQVMKIAEELVAADVVQSIYTAVAAVLGAIGLSDNKITGGSSEGATAGVSIQSFGPPSVEFTFTGYWKAGTVIQLGFTTDAGPGYVEYTVEYPGDGGDTMALFAPVLDANPLVAATFDGTSVTMTAQAPATTVQL